ncbi:hypothetical protein [Kitasatospora sp. NPDC088351]|uniref:hypothetical protein n=1 Tax=unclassified Kitasatospora TaxID=2633591 RepID=UPI0034449474
MGAHDQAAARRLHPPQAVTILNLPKPKRFRVLAEGMAKLAEHVGALHGELQLLQQSSVPRSRVVIDGPASEEAAKILILFDVARMGWDDQEQTKRQLERSP